MSTLYPDFDDRHCIMLNHAFTQFIVFYINFRRKLNCLIQTTDSIQASHLFS